MRLEGSLVLLAVFSSMSKGAPSVAQCGQLQKLTAFDALPGDFFGWSAAMSGDFAAVGARNHPSTTPADPNYQSGAVYVYANSSGTWMLDQKLTAPAGDDNQFDVFGNSLSYQRNLLVIGAPGDDDGVPGSDIGAVYVYRRDPAPTGWVLERKLVRPSGVTAASLGLSVSLWDDTLIAGATLNGSVLGTALVYRRTGTNWNFEAQLVPSHPGTEGFGNAVSLYQNIALIGASNSDISSPDTGAAYVFRRTGTTWQEAQLILDPNPMNPVGGADQFGHALSIFGRAVMVGAPLEQTLGAVYVYNEDATGQYVLNQTLTPGPFPDLEDFGNAVALENGRVVVGSDLGGGSANEGLAYQFNVQLGTWVQVAQHSSLDADPSDEFGSSVAVGNYALIGARRDNEAGMDAGAAYIFSLCP